MATANAIGHPHSSHDRTNEWQSCCMEIFMGRDPKRKRLEEDDTSDTDSMEYDDDEDSIFGGWSSPGNLAINMIEEDNAEGNGRGDIHANLDSWMKAAFALSASIDEVSIMIQRKAMAYVSSTDTLEICFHNKGHKNSEHIMTNADRSILETTVASFAAGMAKQIDSLRQTVVVEGDHPFMKNASPDGNTADGAAATHHWASGPIGHRAGIASCLMQRLKVEIMDPMTKLQSQREKSKKKNTNNASGDAADIAQNPMRLFSLGTGEESMRRALPPAPWEAGGHDAERDWAERDQEEDEFVGVYFKQEERANVATTLEEMTNQLCPPSSVMQFMDLPAPVQTTNPQHMQQFQPPPNIPSMQQQPPQHIPPPSSYEDEDEYMDQLARESATLLATYQHSDLEGVQKVERSMVEVTQLLSRFTDLITEQQEDICMIHDQALKSKDNVDKGQDQLVDAANRGEKSRHPMATFIVVMAVLLLFFNWITP